MGVNRVQDVPFAQIANSALRDKRLSFRARGILAMMLSHTGEWRTNRDWIASQTDHEGRQAIQTALNELTALGYRKVVKQQGPDGRWHNITHWYHAPDEELSQEPDDSAEELVQKTDRRLSRPPVEPTVGILDGHTEDHPTEHHGSEHHLDIPDADDAPEPGIAALAAMFAERLDALNVRHRYGKGGSSDRLWHRDLRLMRDRDGRDEQEIAGAIQWALREGCWWASVVHSPAKLRKHYDRMRLQAVSEQRGRPTRAADLMEAARMMDEGAAR